MGVKHQAHFHREALRGWTLLARAWAVLALSLPLLACGDPAAATRERAFARWQERCKSAGVFIRRTVENVEGIALLKLRTANNFDDQFGLEDPYGRDSIGDEYLRNFLQGFHQPPRVGYRWVEVRSPDGQVYRYTGRLEEPWQTDKSFLQGYTRLVMDRTPVASFTARYGVTFDDISTREDRELWIAGSSLKVIDLETRAVIAERVGYMVDAMQGDRTRQRSPWLFAADNACPSFNRNFPHPLPGPAAIAQLGQTLDFTEKVLQPSR